jgi:hypothetical protein
MLNPTYRQAHKSFFEKSDLFFVCMMRPLSFDIQKQDLEIEAAKVIFAENGFRRTSEIEFLKIKV